MRPRQWSKNLLLFAGLIFAAKLGDATRWLEALTAFVYASAHRPVMRRRREWFARLDGPYTALWWVPAGHTPDVAEAKERLDHLRVHGPTPFAFSSKEAFPAPGEAAVRTTAGIEATCGA